MWNIRSSGNLLEEMNSSDDIISVENGHQIHSKTYDVFLVYIRRGTKCDRSID